MTLRRRSFTAMIFKLRQEQQIHDLLSWGLYDSSVQE